MSRGTNDLIGEGAMPMTNPKSVLEALRIEGESRVEKPREPEMSDVERTVFGFWVRIHYTLMRSASGWT